MDTRWNECAKIHQFRTGLADPIKDEIARMEPPTTFEAYLSACVHIDSRLQERLSEKRLQHGRYPGNYFSPQYSPYPGTYSGHHYQTLAPTVPHIREPDFAPMQVEATRSSNRPRGSLTSQERHRRIELRLYPYCGIGNHQLAHCLNRPSPRTNVNDLKTNKLFSSYSLASLPADVQQHPHLEIPLKLTHSTTSNSASALIDSGASSNFVDAKFAEIHKLPLMAKQTPITVQTIDGSQLTSGRITIETIPLQVTHCDHLETLQFNVI
jgi:hypothetical protein